MKPETPSERFYRLLLRVLPGSFRTAHEEEMSAWFREHAAALAGDGKAFPRTRLWLTLAKDLIRTSVIEHLAEAREAWSTRGGGSMDGMVHDARLALRSFSRRPAFVGLVMATMALGVGSATTVYSVVQAVLMAPLPYDLPNRLFRVGKVSDGRAGVLSVSALDLSDLQERNRSFEALVASRPGFMTLSTDGEPELVRVAMVSAQFFETLGRLPDPGRAWTAEADLPGGAPLAVLSHGIWQRRWGGDPEILGRTVRLDGIAFTVLGIMPADFVPPEALSQRGTEAWIPLAFLNPESRSQRSNGFLQLVGRLHSGVTQEAAADELQALGVELSQDHPGPGERSFGLSPLREETVGDISATLVPLLAAVVLLLTIACINVANLLLMRANQRTREIALRNCIGAGRGRLMRQLMTEAVCLGLGAGLLGGLLALGGIEAFAAYGPRQLPRMEEITLSGRVLVYAVAISLATSILFGVLPALKGSKTDLKEALGGGARGGSGSLGEVRTREVLVVLETALSIVLVIGGGLLYNSLVQLSRVDLGFEADGVGVVSVYYPDSDSPAETTRFFDDVMEGIGQLPGVDAVGATANLPLSGNRQMLRLSAPGLALGDDDRERGGYPTNYQQVTSGYFQAMGITIRSGRGFAREDDARAPRVAVVNEALAARLESDGTALGRRITLSDDPAGDRPIEIVGVVEGTRQQRLDLEGEPELYLPFHQNPTPRMEIVARGSATGSALLPAMRERVWSVRADLPVRRSVDLTEFVAQSVADRSFFTMLVSAFAVLALLLTVVGVYGTLAYAVSQRRRELGVRLALGATGGSVVLTVLLRSLKMVLTGIVLGLCVSVASTRVLESMLFGVTRTDPLTLALGTTVVLVAATAASIIPAKRAARVDPAASLQLE